MTWLSIQHLAAMLTMCTEIIVYLRRQNEIRAFLVKTVYKTSHSLSSRIYFWQRRSVGGALGRAFLLFLCGAFPDDFLSPVPYGADIALRLFFIVLVGRGLLLVVEMPAVYHIHVKFTFVFAISKIAITPGARIGDFEGYT